MLTGSGSAYEYSQLLQAADEALQPTPLAPRSPRYCDTLLRNVEWTRGWKVPCAGMTLLATYNTSAPTESVRGAAGMRFLQFLEPRAPQKWTAGPASALLAR